MRRGGAIAAMPIMGQLIARYGSRTVVRIVAICYFLTLALLGQARSLSHLVLFALLFGAAKGSFDVVLNSAVFAVERLYRRAQY